MAIKHQYRDMQTNRVTQRARGGITEYPRFGVYSVRRDDQTIMASAG